MGGDVEFNSRVVQGGLFDSLGNIAGNMTARREKVREHGDPFRAAADAVSDTRCYGGLCKLEDCAAHMVETVRGVMAKQRGQRADLHVRGFPTTTVSNKQKAVHRT